MKQFLASDIRNFAIVGHGASGKTCLAEAMLKIGGEINRLMKKASAYYAPASAAIAMAESFLNNYKRILPCATYLNGEYGVKDLYVGVPVIIGSKGVEKIIQLKLTPHEKKQFIKSVNSVRNLTNMANKLIGK